ncbi:MAG TPA: phosphate signaling complex protein PhoU [Candidatus Nanopelagicaceae bacterium]
MRNVFHEELESITADHLKMTALVKEAIDSGTRALLGADLQLAESVIAADLAVDAIQHNLDERTLNLIARQQPVASDLRKLVSSLRISADLERMGDLALHIAKLARMRYPNKAVPDEVVEVVSEMGNAASRIVEKMAVVLEFGDTNRALEIDRDDDEMDKLQRKLISTILGPNWVHTVESAVDMAFASRYYERFSDHAVSIAQRVYYIETGEFVPKN